MSRTFAYVRVSTTGQTTENQIHEIESAGFGISLRRVTSETVSGSMVVGQRSGFMRLLDGLAQGDVADPGTLQSIDFTVPINTYRTA